MLWAQAFREYYPSVHDDHPILECVWVKDKFVLHEKMKGSCQDTENEDQRSCGPESTIQYDTLGLINEGWNAYLLVFMINIASWILSCIFWIYWHANEIVDAWLLNVCLSMNEHHYIRHIKHRPNQIFSSFVLCYDKSDASLATKTLWFDPSIFGSMSHWNFW